MLLAANGATETQAKKVQLLESRKTLHQLDMIRDLGDNITHWYGWLKGVLQHCKHVDKFTYTQLQALRRCWMQVIIRLKKVNWRGSQYKLLEYATPLIRSVLETESAWG